NDECVARRTRSPRLARRPSRDGGHQRAGGAILPRARLSRTGAHRRRFVSGKAVAMSQPVVTGIDGGGTHSVAVAVDPAGQVLAEARAGSLNFLSSGLTVARQNLKKLVGLLRRRLPTSEERRVGTDGGIGAV